MCRKRILIFFIFLLIVPAFPVSASAAQLPLTDVPAGEWYYSYVELAYDSGLMAGQSDTVFNPSGNITISQAITLAARVHNSYCDTAESFIQKTPWYQVYVDYAIRYDIIADGEFDDYSAVATRAEMAHIFANALPDSGLRQINSVVLIPDVDKSDKYGSDIYKLFQAGVLTGADEQGTFLPGNPVSRAEAAAIIVRLSFENYRQQFTLVGADSAAGAESSTPGAAGSSSGTASSSAGDIKSTLSIYDYNLPSDQAAGQAFSIKGIITSNYKITSITVGVYNASGTAETYKTVYPYAYYYNIKDIDRYILFGSLTSGAKTYKITAADELGSKVLVSSSFTVGQAQASGGILSSNLSLTAIYPKQNLSYSCKASAVATAVRLITNSSAYTEESFYASASSSSGSYGLCANIGGQAYTGSDGNTYIAEYHTDSDYSVTYADQQKMVSGAIENDLPIVVAVHSNKSGGTTHHWVVLVGASGGDYLIIDPAVSGKVTTMSARNYSFGILNTGYSGYAYGYVSFTKK